MKPLRLQEAFYKAFVFRLNNLEYALTNSLSRITASATPLRFPSSTTSHLTLGAVNFSSLSSSKISLALS